MAQKFSLKNAERVRVTTTQAQQKQVLKLYQELYKDISKQISRMGNKNIKKQNLILLQRDINKRIKEINKEIQTGIVKSMRIVSNEVVSDTRTFLKQCGFKEQDMHNAFMYVPDQVIRNIRNGNIYQDGWTLSETIWGYSKKVQDDINKIISYGTAQGKSAYDVAKHLQTYVNPNKRKKSKTIVFQKYKRGLDGKLLKDANGNYIPDGKPNKFYFGNVDYNAQRLARTLISHAYQQSFEAVNENNPFVVSYIWHSAGLHGRTCQLCLDRDGETFKKHELPLDHPNGMCTFEAYIPDDMSTIADRIGRWYQSPIGTDAELDRYAEDFLR